AMVQETFTVNFMAAMIAKGYLFVPVGHAQLVLYTYPVVAINKAFFSRLSLFDQFQAFSLAWHAWSGMIVFGALPLTLKAPLTWCERSLLLLAPLLSPLLLRTS